MYVSLIPAYCVDSIKAVNVSGHDFLIGRGKHCHMQIVTPDISRTHCRIRVEEIVTVRDLESRNGTFVNGQRIQGEHLLQPGDVLGLGSTLLVVEIRTESPHDHAVEHPAEETGDDISRAMPHSSYFHKYRQRELTDSV